MPTGELQRGPLLNVQNNILVNPDYTRVIARIVSAVAPYPEAREAVIAASRDLDAASDSTPVLMDRRSGGAPSVARPRATPAQPSSDHRPELQHPAPHRFTGNLSRARPEKGILKTRPIHWGPMVRIRLPPAARWYGAGDGPGPCARLTIRRRKAGQRPPRIVIAADCAPGATDFYGGRLRNPAFAGADD